MTESQILTEMYKPNISEERYQELIYILARLREKERNDNMYKYVPNRKVSWMSSLAESQV